MHAATEFPELPEYFVRRKRGFVRSSFVASNSTGDDWGRFTRPIRPVRGCLAIVVAPLVFLGLILLAAWLTGGFSEDEFRNHAGQDPNPFVAVPVGILFAALVLTSPMIVTQWIYPANCLVLRNLQNPGQRLLEVRDRMAITLHSVVYSIRGPSHELLATVRHDLFTRHYEVRDAAGKPILHLANEKSVAPGAETVVWLAVVCVLTFLAALLFRAATVPGMPSGDKGEFCIWLPEAFHDPSGQSVGEAVYGAEPQPHVRIRVDEAVVGRVDRRIVLGLATVVLTS